MPVNIEKNEVSDANTPKYQMVSTRKKNRELSSCYFDMKYLAFLESMLTGLPLKGITKFADIGRMKGFKTARNQVMEGYIKCIGSGQEQRKSCVVIGLEDLERVLNANNNTGIAKQTHQFKLRQASEERGLIFQEDSDQSGFDKVMAKILPNYQGDVANAVSTISFFLPCAKELTTISKWRLFEISTDMLSREEVTKIKSTQASEVLSNSLRFAVFLTLLRQLNTNLTAKNFQNITYQAVSQILTAISKDDPSQLTLSEHFNSVFFEWYLKLERESAKAKSDKYRDVKIQEINNLKFVLSMLPKNAPDMKAAIIHSTKTQNRARRDIELELEAQEANASQAICYFMAAMSGIIVNIKLPKNAQGKIENIIVAPQIFTDTVKQTQSFLNVDHTKFWHLKTFIKPGGKEQSENVIWKKGNQSPRIIKRRKREKMTEISKSIYNAEVVKKGTYIAKRPPKSEVVYPPYVPEPRNYDYLPPKK